MRAVAQRKMFFRLVMDADGYPPFTVESLWVDETEAAGEYRMNNTPFFVRNATLGDIVRGAEVEGRLEFCGTVVRSSNSLVRVVFYDPAATTEVRDHLTLLGCSSEWFESRKLIAVNIPAAVDLRRVQHYLASMEARGVIDYEEPMLRHPELPPLASG